LVGLKYMFKKVYILISFLLSINLVYAQTSGIRVYLIDKLTMMPIQFANVVVEQGRNEVAGTMTDEGGIATLKPLDPGKYSIQVSFPEYKNIRQDSILVIQDKVSSLVIEMPAGHGDTAVLNTITMIDSRDKENLHCCHLSTASYIINGIVGPCVYNLDEPYYNCWSSGNFYRGDISNLPTTDINYILGFFPRH